MHAVSLRRASGAESSFMTMAGSAAQLSEVARNSASGSP